MQQEPRVELTVLLTETEAWAFAQFLKRVGDSDYRRCAASDAEAQHMRDAGEHVRRALAEHGYAPR
ncbi:MAG: hypothetical protein HYX63_12405 [Gammaproteobacteria bacterium]|nr:hypothetical protein [Gammaproteobacteria bacterium]